MKEKINTNYSPLLSIIVPIYNVEKYLNKCIESICNQTYSNLEIILVNDGSTDNSYDICKVWSKKDKRIIVINKKNGGLSDARNIGLSNSIGEYIGFVDSDDWIDIDMYKTLIDIALENNSDIASCGYSRILDNELEYFDYKKDQCEDSIFIFDAEEALSNLMDGKILSEMVCNKIYKRKLIRNMKFILGKCHEDVFWTYKVIGNSERVAVTTRKFYNYIQRQGSIMNQEYSIKRLDVLEALDLRAKYIQDKYPSLIYKAKRSYIGSCLYHYQSVCRCNNYETKKNCKNIIMKRLKKEKFIFKYYKGSIKQYIWIKFFSILPNEICKLRNKLGIGI